MRCLMKKDMPTHATYAAKPAEHCVGDFRRSSSLIRCMEWLRVSEGENEGKGRPNNSVECGRVKGRTLDLSRIAKQFTLSIMKSCDMNHAEGL